MRSRSRLTITVGVHGCVTRASRSFTPTLSWRRRACAENGTTQKRTGCPVYNCARGVDRVWIAAFITACARNGERLWRVRQEQSASRRRGWSIAREPRLPVHAPVAGAQHAAAARPVHLAALEALGFSRQLLPGKLADVVKTASRYNQTASSSASGLADLGAEAHLGRPEGGLVLEGVDVARCHHQDSEDHSAQGDHEVQHEHEYYIG